MAERQALKPRFAGILIATVAGGAAIAHPHKDVDQQVLLSVGTGKISVQIRIAPSYNDGAAIFAHIDTDGDGVISAPEGRGFGLEVISSSVLNVDGVRFEFGEPRVSVPEIEWLSAGLGLIEVDATAAVNLTARSHHSVDFEISYQELAHEWFLQPFYYPDLMRLLPSQAIERSPSGDRVEILLWAKGVW
jgi:hypothetical protein